MSYFPEIVDLHMREAFVHCEKAARHEFIDHLIGEKRDDDYRVSLKFQEAMKVARVTYFDNGLRDSDDYGPWRAGQLATEYSRNRGKSNSGDRASGLLDSYLIRWELGKDGYHPYVAEGSGSVIGRRAMFALNVRHPVTQLPLKLSIYIPMLAVNEESGSFTVIEDRVSDAYYTGAWCDLSSDITGMLWAAREITGISEMDCEVRKVTRQLVKTATPQVLRTRRNQWMLDSWFEQVEKDFADMASNYKKNKWGMQLNQRCEGCDYQSLCLDFKAKPSNLINVTWLPGERVRRAI